MARVGEIQVNAISKGSGADTVLKDGTEIVIPLGGVIDLAKECEKVTTEILRLELLVEGVRKKLSNEKFLSAAPVDVVEKERLKEDSFLQQLAVLKKKRSNLSDV
jgi:valyl-tRNA synthetase